MAIAGALLVLAPFGAAAAPPSKKLDLHLQRQVASGASTERVIVRTRGGKRSEVARKLRDRGHHVYGDHPGVEAFSVEVPVTALEGLANDPSVESISTDADVESLESKKSSSSTSTSTEPVLSSLFATLGFSNYNLGSTIGVAVLDSGLQSNGNFTGRVLEFNDFTGSVPLFRVTPYDDYGHGSHVAGLVGSSGALSSGRYDGPAQAVRFLILKVLDKNGKGKTSTIINAIEYVIANKDRLGIYVINLSLGHRIYEPAATDPLVQEVERATRAGLIVVAAAGNNGRNPETGLPGYAGITSPGNAPDAITVGASRTADTAIRSDDRVAPYSSLGPTWYDGFAKPDIVAPGNTLVSDAPPTSTLVKNYPSLVVTYNLQTYLKLSGTSMATGVVSGLVATMLEVNRYGATERAKQLYGARYVNSGAWTPPPYPTANAIKAMLQYSATSLRDDNGIKYDALTQGAGEVNGLGALTLAYTIDTSKPAGAAWSTMPIDPHTAFGTENVAWSQSIIWGTNVVSGADVMTVNQQAWAQNVVWGTADDDNIVWGTNVVWGTSLDWSDNIVWGTDVVWDTAIVWGTNIVWGTLDDDNIVWGTSGVVAMDSILLGAF